MSDTLKEGSTRCPEDDEDDEDECVLVETWIERTRSIWAFIWSNLLGEVTKLTDPETGEVGDDGCVAVITAVDPSVGDDGITLSGPKPSRVGEDGMLWLLTVQLPCRLPCRLTLPTPPP